MIRLIRASLLAALLLLPTLLLTAQESGEDAPEIEYIRSPSGYNVPVLGGAWELTSTDNTSVFTHPDINAQIIISSVDTTDETAAITDVLQRQLGDDVPLPEEPVYRDTVSLDSGTWTQEIYQAETVTASALASYSRGAMRVISFVESDATTDTYQLIVRAPEPDTDDNDAPIDPAVGVEVAIETLYDDTLEPVVDSRTIIELPTGDWVRTDYESETGDNLTTFGFAFNNAIYTTLTEGDPQNGAITADAFNTVFLGFFTTPRTTEYLNLGLFVVFAIFGFFILSIVWRYRNARKDMQLIEQLEEDE